MQETLKGSLLSYMGPNPSQDDIREAFCRDIDAYSFEFDQPPVQSPAPSSVNIVNTINTTPGYRDERPEKCDVVPQSACAVGYDSHDCDGKMKSVENKISMEPFLGGWKLVIPIGELRFRWFTSYWSYRNDMDTVGVRAGCTLTGMTNIYQALHIQHFLAAYSDSSFNGDRIDIRADNYDR